MESFRVVRIEQRRDGEAKEGQRVVGLRVGAKVGENEVAAPFRMAEFDIMFSEHHPGISREGDLIDLGVDLEIIKKLGSFFSYGELRLGQGRENSKAYLRENPSLADEIERAVREACSLPPLPQMGSEAEQPVAPEPEPVE